MIIRRTSVFLISVAVPTSFCFVPLPDGIKQFSPSPLAANNFLDTVKDGWNKALEQPPKVSIPDGFQVPEPKPLSVTRSSELPSLLKSSVALGLRLGTGAFTLGWKIDSLFADEEDGKYALELGPIRLRDSSTVLQDAPRPEKPLIIYEYEASPFCRRVREMVNLLDLTVEYRPCPGARAGFSDELFARTGRRTVPYMIDPNTTLALRCLRVTIKSNTCLIPMVHQILNLTARHYGLLHFQHFQLLRVVWRPLFAILLAARLTRTKDPIMRR